MRKMTLFMTTMALSTAMLFGCSSSKNSNEDTSSDTTVAVTDADDDENYDTGDASLDDIRNQDEIGDNELLVLSFGTSYNDSRRLTIGAIENDLEAAFPDYSVRRGFTSNIIINHVQERDGLLIDDVEAALTRAVDNGVKNLVVQPTHLMHGLEYDELVEEVAQYSDAFENVIISEPLLSSDDDFARVEKAITDWTAEYDDEKTAICFMGHGTEADSNEVYQKLQDLLTADGYANYYVATVEAEPSLEDLLASVQAGDYERVVLEPLMVVAGDHANNDMAGDDEDSWKSTFEKAGYEVICLLRGLGENEDIRQIYIDHAQTAIDSLAGDTEAVKASSLKDGTYDIQVDSSSDMFNITDCKLTVENGEMTAVMTMGGTGYLYVYMGTSEDALNASEEEYISYEEVEDGVHTFTVPVAALNTGIDCAAFSKRKELWYDRTLVFRADSLPADAFADGAVTSAESLNLADGTYLIDVTLEGGSGKASVSSPARLTMEDGKSTAEIIWSSSNYDYMMVNGTKYEPVNTEGNSVFEIPVSVFDSPMAVSADTTAMSTPHEIEYTLTFSSVSIQLSEE